MKMRKSMEISELEIPIIKLKFDYCKRIYLYVLTRIIFNYIINKKCL